MRGLVFASTVVGANSTLRVSFVQCTNCRGDTTPPDAHEVNWSAISVDGGRRWRTSRQRNFLLAFGLALPEGHDVWQAGYRPHPTDPDFYVSHDSGRTFHPADASADAGFTPITLGDGVAWALGTRCVHYQCVSSVLTGRSAGSSLTHTATQPPGMPKHRAPSALVVAGYGPRGYVSQGNTRHLYVTGDAGHVWTLAAYPCAADADVQALSPTTDSVVWATCVTTRHAGRSTAARQNVIVRRSADGGTDWQTPSPTFHLAIGDLVAASPQVAWAQGADGQLSRTGNAGRSWQTVLRGVGRGPAITVQNTTTAAVIATATSGTTKTHSRRTDLIAYRTTTAGDHWNRTVIHLPQG